MKIGSLCSGMGALDLAAEEWFDGETVWHCEYEPAPAAILARHWPGVPNHHDLTKLDWTDVDAIDVLTAGYPCQPFSMAGQRKGLDDARHLWPYIAAGVRALRPRYVFLENVAGHRSIGFGTVLGDLAALGYDVRWTSIRAADVGAPHRRERVFILATNTDSDAVRDQHVAGAGGRAALDSGRGDGDVPDAGRDEARDAIGGRGGEPGATEEPRGSAGVDADGRDDGRRGHPQRDELEATRIETPQRNDTDRRATADTTDIGRPVGVTEPTRLERRHDARTSSPRPVPHTRGEELPRRTGLRAQFTARIRGRRLSDHNREIEWRQFGPAVERWETVTRRAPAPVELNSLGSPRLAARFAEWMMGLPDGWICDTEVPVDDGDQLDLFAEVVFRLMHRNDQLKAAGNGVVPQQAFRALELLDVG